MLPQYSYWIHWTQWSNHFLTKMFVAIHFKAASLMLTIPTKIHLLKAGLTISSFTGGVFLSSVVSIVPALSGWWREQLYSRWSGGGTQDSLEVRRRCGPRGIFWHNKHIICLWLFPIYFHTVHIGWMDGLTSSCIWHIYVIEVRGTQGDMWRQVVRTPLHPLLVYLPFVPCMALTLSHQCRVARWDASEEFKERGQTHEPKSVKRRRPRLTLTTHQCTVHCHCCYGKPIGGQDIGTKLCWLGHWFGVVLQILTMWLLLRQGN